MSQEEPGSPAALQVVRLGAIGVDSSHLPEFTRRIKGLNEGLTSRCRVTAFYDPGDHQMAAPDVAQWRREALAMGVKETASIDALLDEVDGVLVLAVSGHSHAGLALPALRRGIPTYIDKPLTCDLAEAEQLLATARACNAPCYSASSLRFADEVTRLDRQKVGPLQVVSAFGPGELNRAMPGLFFYGVHTIEMVDALWGPGVDRVRATTSSDRDLVELHYADGRFAQLRMERKGCYDFGATVHGTLGVETFKVNFSQVYDRLILAMVRFFEGGPPPVDLRNIIENVAVMEAGNLSMARSGTWVEVASLA